VCHDLPENYCNAKKLRDAAYNAANRKPAQSFAQFTSASHANLAEPSYNFSFVFSGLRENHVIPVLHRYLRTNLNHSSGGYLEEIGGVTS
jgi:hypothetical protein